MGQMGLFDVAQRYAGLDAKQDPLLGSMRWSLGRASAGDWRRFGASRRRSGGRRPGASPGTRSLFKAIMLLVYQHVDEISLS